MIQRRQTLYLLLIFILGIVNCILPIVEFITPPSELNLQMWQLSAFGLKNYEIEQNLLGQSIPIKGLSVLGITAILIPLFALIDIFLYNKRIKQARFNIFLSTLCLGFYAIAGVYIWEVSTKGNMEWSFTISACIPLICFVLTLMATRLILKDEALVRASDRLR